MSIYDSLLSSSIRSAVITQRYSATYPRANWILSRLANPMSIPDLSLNQGDVF